MIIYDEAMNAVKAKLTQGFEYLRKTTHDLHGVESWENPQTGQIRLFDLTKARYCETPIPKDDYECVKVGAWIPLRMAAKDVE